MPQSDTLLFYSNDPHDSRSLIDRPRSADYDNDVAKLCMTARIARESISMERFRWARRSGCVIGWKESHSSPAPRIHTSEALRKGTSISHCYGALFISFRTVRSPESAAGRREPLPHWSADV